MRSCFLLHCFLLLPICSTLVHNKLKPCTAKPKTMPAGRVDGSRTENIYAGGVSFRTCVCAQVPGHPLIFKFQQVTQGRR